MIKVTIALLTIFFLSCKQNNNNTLVNTKTDTLKTQSEIKVLSTTKTKMIKANDYVFFSDSILHGHKDVLKYYFTRYSSDTCETIWYENTNLVNNFKGLEALGDINHNGISDSVFVLDELNYCNFDEEVNSNGQAYYFTDTTLPRLQTDDSHCCYPSCIFVVGDIDEDGVSEIGQYFSSCASRYKSLYVYSLKNKKWKQVGHSVYDLLYVDEKKPFSYYVQKVSKNKFKMLEITDLTDDKSKIGKQNWKHFRM